MITDYTLCFTARVHTCTGSDKDLLEVGGDRKHADSDNSLTINHMISDLTVD